MGSTGTYVGLTVGTLPCHWKESCIISCQGNSATLSCFMATVILKYEGKHSCERNSTKKIFPRLTTVFRKNCFSVLIVHVFTEIWSEGHYKFYVNSGKVPGKLNQSMGLSGISGLFISIITSLHLLKKKEISWILDVCGINYVWARTDNLIQMWIKI